MQGSVVFLTQKKERRFKEKEKFRIQNFKNSNENVTSIGVTYKNSHVDIYVVVTYGDYIKIWNDNVNN